MRIRLPGKRTAGNIAETVEGRPTPGDKRISNGLQDWELFFTNDILERIF